MLDQMSRGRVELGVGRGISLIESAVYGIDDVEESRGRYRETLDIFFNACGQSTLEHEGEHFNYHDVELHTEPYQKPYPPLWFPSSSPDIVDFVARHGYNTAIPGAPENVRPMLEMYREIWMEHQDDEGRHNAHVAAPRLGRNQHVFVAETDAEAEAIAPTGDGDVGGAHQSPLPEAQRLPHGRAAAGPQHSGGHRRLAHDGG